MNLAIHEKRNFFSPLQYSKVFEKTWNSLDFFAHPLYSKHEWVEGRDKLRNRQNKEESYHMTRRGDTLFHGDWKEKENFEVSGNNGNN
jgi:hypothetical protein